MKTHQTFLPTPRDEGIFKFLRRSPVILDLCLIKTRSGKSHDCCDAIVFEKQILQNVSVRNKMHAKPVFLNSSGVESIFRKLRFSDSDDALVWTIGSTIEIKG